MLFLTTVTRWIGIGRSDNVIIKASGTPYVFDINNVTNLKAEGTGSKFLYTRSTSNTKGGYDEIHCTSSYQTIRDEYGVDPITTVLELSVFPNGDHTKTPTTRYISIYDFCYAWAHNPYPQYSWLVYSEKSRRDVRVLVNMTLTDLVGKDNQFDENNSQWFFFVDPLEQIHPEWTIYNP